MWLFKSLTSLSYRVYYASLTHHQSLCLPHLSFYISPLELWNGLALFCLNVTLWGEVRPEDEHAASAEPWEWMKAWQLSSMLTDELLSPVYPNEKPWCAHSGWRGLEKSKKKHASEQTAGFTVIPSLMMSWRSCLTWYAFSHIQSIWTLKAPLKINCITNH